MNRLSGLAIPWPKSSTVIQLSVLFVTLLFVISLGALACYLPLSAQLKRPAIYGIQGAQE